MPRFRKAPNGVVSLRQTEDLEDMYVDTGYDPIDCAGCPVAAGCMGWSRCSRVGVGSYPMSGNVVLSPGSADGIAEAGQ